MALDEGAVAVAELLGVHMTSSILLHFLSDLLIENIIVYLCRYAASIIK